MPGTFENISLKRCILDIFLTLAGYTACSSIGMDIALDNTRQLRRSLIMNSKE